MAFKFEGLKVWQKAIDLSVEIDSLTKSFPKDELYVLTSQIKRASDSISLNIAEGSTDQSNAEFSRFLSYSIRSNIEVVSCLHLGKRRNIIKQEDFEKLYAECEQIHFMLIALKKSLK
ncbi:MAG: four helix bundle protein [Sphingobacteriales bacterium]|nr:four helix bundle protein [Sphingobacteriales bacterium]